MAMSTGTWAKTVALEEYDTPFTIKSDDSYFPYEQLFTVGKMDARTWQTYPWAGFGPPGLTDELEAIRFEDAEELRAFIMTAIKYTHGFTVSDEFQADNRNISGLLNQFADDMGSTFVYAKELYMTSLWNNAFSSYALNYTPTAGEAMCQASHALTKSTKTISNSGGAVDINYTSLNNAYDYLTGSMFNESGIPVSDLAVSLMCHTSKRRLVEKVLQSMNEPDTADRNTNVLKGKNIKVIYNRLLDSGKWFVFGEGQRKHNQFRTRLAPKTEWQRSFNNQGEKCSNTMRIAAGTTDYRRVYGFNVV